MNFNKQTSKKLITIDNPATRELLSKFSQSQNTLQCRHFIQFLKVLFNLFMRDGKKHKVSSIFFKVFLLIKQDSLGNPLDFLLTSFHRLKPMLMLQSQHQGRLRRAVPIPITKNRQIFLSATWLKRGVMQRPEKGLDQKIFNELKDINSGEAQSLKFKKKFYQEIFKNRSYIRLLKFRK